MLQHLLLTAPTLHDFLSLTSSPSLPSGEAISTSYAIFGQVNV